MKRRPSLTLLFIFLTLTSLWIFLFAPVQAQTQVGEAEAAYLFGEQITFHARIQSPDPVEQVLIFYRVAGSNESRQGLMELTPEGDAVFRLDLTQQPLRAFSTITYWFEISTQGREPFTSETYPLFYEDNRFSWQARESGPFKVHWYEGDSGFAQDVLDVAQTALQRVQNLLPLELNAGQIDIYAYSTAIEMQTTLSAANPNWVAAGHADPDLGVMVVALPAGPDQSILMEQRIPHELMHILLYHDTQTSYSNIPTWLNEGMASNAEMYPNPDYLVLLESAREKGSLLPISSLCRTFPRDASSALLAYAESESFTRFLHKNFGASGLQDLVSQYKDGLDCGPGIQRAFGRTLPQLEHQWRREAFGESPLLTALKKLSPWFVLLLLALAAPLGLIFLGLRKKPPTHTGRPSTAQVYSGRPKG
jgi:hypothetical protein